MLGIQGELRGRGQLFVADRSREGITGRIESGIGGVDTHQDDSRMRKRPTSPVQPTRITQDDTARRPDAGDRRQRRIVDELVEHILFRVPTGRGNGRKERSVLTAHLRTLYISERPHRLIDIAQQYKDLDDALIFMVAMQSSAEIGGSPSHTGMLCQTSM